MVTPTTGTRQREPQRGTFPSKRVQVLGSCSCGRGACGVFYQARHFSSFAVVEMDEMCSIVDAFVARWISAFTSLGGRRGYVGERILSLLFIMRVVCPWRSVAC